MSDSSPAFEDPRKALARHGLRPKRSFSQNFLVSEHAVESIAAEVVRGGPSMVVELGPGLGTLTAAILRRGASVVAVERDRDMLAVLSADFSAYPRARFVEGDAATVELQSLFAKPPPNLVVTGNLPYAITGAIFRRLIEERQTLTRAVVMVQKEVADRLVAQPGSRTYGALSVFVQAAFDVKRVLSVPAGAFHPPPKVDSAVVALTKGIQARADETPSFRRVVKAAFEQRRKTLRNALLSGIGDASTVDASLLRAGVDGTRRGETLSVEEFRALGEALALEQPATAGT